MPLTVPGETAKPWPDVIAFYQDLSRSNPVFDDIAKLAEGLAASPFRAAGLCAVTSMHDLILGPSTQVLANPYLLIEPRFEPNQFRISYQDGSPTPWSRMVQPADAFGLIVRVFTKYARWYTETGSTA